MTDDELEVEINRAYAELIATTTPQELALKWDQMARLVAQRSAARVRQMEAERGIG